MLTNSNLFSQNYDNTFIYANDCIGLLLIDGDGIRHWDVFTFVRENDPYFNRDSNKLAPVYVTKFNDTSYYAIWELFCENGNDTILSTYYIDVSLVDKQGKKKKVYVDMSPHQIEIFFFKDGKKT